MVVPFINLYCPLSRKVIFALIFHHVRHWSHKRSTEPCACIFGLVSHEQWVCSGKGLIRHELFVGLRYFELLGPHLFGLELIERGRIEILLILGILFALVDLALFVALQLFILGGVMRISGGMMKERFWIFVGAAIAVHGGILPWLCWFGALHAPINSIKLYWWIKIVSIDELINADLWLI